MKTNVRQYFRVLGESNYIGDNFGNDGDDADDRGVTERDNWLENANKFEFSEEGKGGLGNILVVQMMKPTLATIQPKKTNPFLTVNKLLNS